MNTFCRTVLAVCFLPLLTPPAMAGPNKEIRDWYVSCDNVLECTMQTYNNGRIYGFGFVRSPKANSEAVLFLSTSFKLREKGRMVAIFDGDESNRILIETDLGTFKEGTWTFPGQNRENEILDALKSGRSMVLELDTAEGLIPVPISLSGVTGSALFMDEAQERVGRKDALHAKGDGEPRDFKSRVTELRSSDDLPKPVFDYWKNSTDGCGDGFEPDDDLIASFGGISVALENDDKLFVLPCGSPGAYNLPQTVLAFDGERKQVRIAPLPVMGTRGPTVIDYAYNTDWDDRKSTLTAYYKGRGLGDCGVRTVWHWEGGFYSNFQLLEEYSKENCDGKYDDWPQVWPPQ